jgi:hypothetical protein
MEAIAKAPQPGRPGEAFRLSERVPPPIDSMNPVANGAFGRGPVSPVGKQ